MVLSPAGIANAEVLQKRGLLLREIARDMGVDYVDVVLGLYGEVPAGTARRAAGAPSRPAAFEAPLQPIVAEQNTPRGESGTAREAPGGQPLPASGDIGDLKQGPEAAPRHDSQAKASVGNAATTPIAAEAGIGTGPDLDEEDGQGGSGDASRPSAGGGTGAGDLAAAEPHEVANSSPETAQEKVGGGPAAAAPFNAEEAGRTSAYATRGRSGTPPDAGVTAGETAPSSLPALSLALRYRLRAADGQHLHAHERGLTRLPSFFWRGRAPDIARLKREKPEWADLVPEEIRT